MLIDAEGYDANIVIDLLQNSSFRPIIIFEYIHVQYSYIQILKKLLKEKNYKYIKVNENLVCFPSNTEINITI